MLVVKQVVCRAGVRLSSPLCNLLSVVWMDENLTMNLSYLLLASAQN